MAGRIASADIGVQSRSSRKISSEIRLAWSIVGDPIGFFPCRFFDGGICWSLDMGGMDTLIAKVDPGCCGWRHSEILWGFLWFGKSGRAVNEDPISRYRNINRNNNSRLIRSGRLLSLTVESPVHPRDRILQSPHATMSRFQYTQHVSVLLTSPNIL